MQTNLYHILFSCFFLFLFFNSTQAQEIDSTRTLRIPAEREAIFPLSDSLLKSTPIVNPNDDIIQEDSTKTKSFLTDNVISTAKDYMMLDAKNKKAYLYNEAKIVYGDITLEAGKIILNNATNEVYAFGIKDSLGNYTQRPVFSQGQNIVEPDSIRFNFDTQKALVYNSRTQQGEFNVKGAITKKENDSVYFMQNVKFTTAKDIDNPEYYFNARQVKLVPEKKVITGLVTMYIADVPTPLMLPFGYFPLTDERSSGIILPSFGDNQNRGYFLQNGGYYFNINEYVDLAVLGDYYTNGSFGFRAESNYALRYKFRGNFSFRYEKLLNSEPGFPDYSESSIYNIRWSHSQDAKANPSSRFQASVNLGSSQYYQESINQTNTANFLNNNLSSSVSYSKTFSGFPEVNLNIAATHNQNTNTKEINMTLPSLNASMSRIYPFAPKNGTKKGIFENINFQYSLRGENRIKTTDSLFFKPQMFRDMQSGIKHSIPIATNFKLFKHFSVSAGTNFEENWVFKTIEQRYDQDTQAVVRDTLNGFDSFRTYNFSSSIGTTVYGQKNFGKDKKIQAIRHVIRPSLSYTLTPSFDQFYDTYLVPATSTLEARNVSYSRFEGSLFGAPGNRYASSIGFNVTNDFEAKITSRDTTATEPIKRKLLSNFSLGTSYNMAADSLKLQPVVVRGSLPVVQDKLTINFNGALDPYALNNSNERIDKWNINNGGSLFRLTRAQASFSYSFSNKDFERDQDEQTDDLENESFRNGGRPDDLFGRSADFDGKLYEDEEEEVVENETKRYNYSIPWNLRIAYSMTYDNLRRNNEISGHSIMFSGDVELSPRWKVGASSGFDFVNPGFTFTQLRFQRDLESWRLSFNWTPFGDRESWYFFIGIKANVLQDLKYDKNRERDRRL